VIWRREDAEGKHAEGRHAEPRRDEVKGAVGDGRRETGGRRMADQQGGEVTIVGQGAKLEGTVVSAGSLRIDGQIKGQVNADGDVMLSPQSSVEADIRAQNVSVAGRFKGSIVAKGRAEIARGGRVDGNITSKTLVVEEGAVFQGQSIMDQQAQAAQAPQQAPARAEAPRAEDAKV
jgi:cytoskeletal protein CcmA (bactofilin family)